jgi:hypothetical protein
VKPSRFLKSSPPRSITTPGELPFQEGRPLPPSGDEDKDQVSDLGLRDCVHNVVHTGIGDRTCPIPYLCCTLLACEVELVDTEGSYLSCTRVRFLS